MGIHLIGTVHYNLNGFDKLKKALEIDQFYIPAKECLKVIEDVLEKKIKKEAAIHLFKGVLYYLKRMFDKEIAEYKKAIVIDPNFKKRNV